MTPGQRVRVAKTVPWSTQDEAVAPRPTVGLRGKVGDPDVYPFPTPPRGRTAVIFKSTDLGFEPDEEHPTVCLYVPTKCLEAL